MDERDWERQSILLDAAATIRGQLDRGEASVAIVSGIGHYLLPMIERMHLGELVAEMVAQNCEELAEEVRRMAEERDRP